MKKIIFILFIVILLSGCSYGYFVTHKDYYSKFKNPDLNYTWEFNKDLEKGGGETFNRTYFQLKKYNLFQELFLLEIAYPVQYKHEEGHIYQLQLLNVDSLDKLYNKTCHRLDPTKEYFVSVSEGSADYYSLTFFNNSLSNNSLEFTKNNIKNERFKRYYQGYLFTNYVISKQIYPDLKNFILNLCTKKQYELFQEYIGTLNLS